MTALPHLTIADHERHLRHAIELARQSRANGNHPFGAMLVGPDGRILLEAENGAIPAIAPPKPNAR